MDAFLSRPDLGRRSLRVYAETLGRIRQELGEEADLTSLDPPDVEAAAVRAWSGCSPTTWNRHLAVLRSFSSYCQRRGWLAQPLAQRLERRKEPPDRTKAIPYAELERLWQRENVSLREKAFWRLLYETAARAQEILNLNVEDLDLANKRARIRSKGGATEWIHWQSGSARVLPRLIGQRSHGPLFLGDRRLPPARTPASVDVDQETGRARLSYRRAEELFQEASGGWTLHQLRHSAITHLAEQGVSTVLLMAKSRHTSLRSLQRYARPGPEAVAALTAAFDPARRRG